MYKIEITVSSECHLFYIRCSIQIRMFTSSLYLSQISVKFTDNDIFRLENVNNFSSQCKNEAISIKYLKFHYVNRSQNIAIH